MDEYLAGRTCANCDGQKELTLVSGEELWISVCDGAVLIDGMPHFVLCECCYRKILEEATSMKGVVVAHDQGETGPRSS